MKFIYLGSEVPSNRKLLESAGVKTVGFSFWRLTQRGLPKTKTYLLSNYFHENMEIHVSAGIPRPLELTAEELDLFAVQYSSFVSDNIGRIATVTEIDNTKGHPDFRQKQRDIFWKTVPEERFIPMWDSATGPQGLGAMAREYTNVGISGEDLETQVYLAATTQTLSSSYGTRFHAVACARPDNLRQVQVETASSLAWLSPMMHGETIVWDGTKLVRYPKRMKDQARSRYSHVYEKAGLNFDLIAEDNPQEVSKLALWSYAQLEKRLNMIGQSTETPLLYDKSDEMGVDTFAELEPLDADNKGMEVRKLLEPDLAKLSNLPVFGYELVDAKFIDKEGNEVIEGVPVVRTQSASLRQCSTCFVSANCPAFTPGSACAFKLPVEVKTKDQLKGLMNAIIEMQGQRVAFMRFAEELNGGYADPNLSNEVDRLLRLMKTTKEINDDSAFTKVTIEQRGASSGALSRIFGDKKEEPKQITNEVIYDEAEVTEILRSSVED